MTQATESKLRNFYRDPVEHGLWSVWYPVIAEWLRRPYLKNLTISLNVAASKFSFGARDMERYEAALKHWRAAQAEFIGDTEYHSFGAISAKLLEAGNENGAELVRKMAAKRQPIIEAVRKSQMDRRADLKRLLSEGGVSPLLEEERYKPASYGEQLGNEPVKLTLTQTSIFDVSHVKVKSLYALEESDDGYRLLCDHFPPRIHPKRASPYVMRVGRSAFKALVRVVRT
ncbi:MAG: hypothetical protein IPI41_08800 [Flavobacteriales bacterium]|nr:hypothetical protein [Flavobacteriales bacterium]